MAKTAKTAKALDPDKFEMDAGDPSRETGVKAKTPPHLEKRIRERKDKTRSDGANTLTDRHDEQ